MQAQRQAFVFYPGPRNLVQRGRKMPSHLREDRATSLGNLVDVTQPISLKFQSMVADIAQPRHAHHAPDIAQRPAADHRHMHP